MGNPMFCYQCQETARGTGCTMLGVCGKHPETSARMDLLLYAVRGISIINRALRTKGEPSRDASHFVIDALFTTITNANFDNAFLDDFIRRAFQIKNLLAGTAKKQGIELPDLPQVEFYASPEDAEKSESFNGVFLFTSNCIVPPRKNCTYLDRVYTTGVVGMPGTHHIPRAHDGKPKDFSQLIAHAQKCPPPTAIEHGEIIGGFAHHQVIELAPKILDLIKRGKIRKFVVMAGCDGRFPSRDYYTNFAQALPNDCVILTAGCAKYRYNKLPLGDIEGVPRVLDAGQCNDSYSLVRIALALRDALGLKDVNQLPIVYNIAWYEQKAVIVLLALLALGVRNIHTGPTLPAFFTPDILKVLQDKFHIGTITNVQQDIHTLIG